MNLKVAIIDLYDNTPNQGMRAIKELLAAESFIPTFETFDVRSKNEIPDLSYDIYISTGGPGDPREGDGIWDKKYFQLLNDIVEYNKVNEDKKHVLLICHSFQMACLHFGVGQITKRDKRSFGTFPVNKSIDGQNEWLLKNLPDPFYAADFRDYQVTNPDMDDISEKGYQILAWEDHTQVRTVSRAIMGVRFSDEIIGFQFHPEADSIGMIVHFKDNDRKEHVIKEFSQDRYDSMIEDLSDPQKVTLTHSQIIPGFLKSAADEKLIPELA